MEFSLPTPASLSHLIYPFTRITHLRTYSSFLMKISMIKFTALPQISPPSLFPHDENLFVAGDRRSRVHRVAIPKNPSLNKQLINSQKLFVSLYLAISLVQAKIFPYNSACIAPLFSVSSLPQIMYSLHSLHRSSPRLTSPRLCGSPSG